jgi:hypothetical protein
MEDIEALKAAVDVLVARSMAQEAMLCFFMRSAQLKQPLWPELDIGTTVDQLRDHLRHSSLTDQQLALYEREVKRFLESLHATTDLDHRDLLF